MFVRVAIPIPSAKTFTYAVPERLVPAAAVGKRVVVPFGRRRLTGWIIEIRTEATCEQTVKEIHDLPDPDPLFGPENLAFFEWISRYYLHPLGKVLAEVLPGGIDLKSERWIRLAEGAAHNPSALSAGQRQIVERLALFPEGLTLRHLCRATGKNDLYGDLRALEAAGVLFSEERVNLPAIRPKREKWIGIRAKIPVEIRLTKKQSELVAILRESSELPLSRLENRFRETVFLRALEAQGILRLFERELSRGAVRAPEIGRNENDIILNGAQAETLAEIRSLLASGGFSPCLLHGVTGSGKTEVYLRAVAEVLQNGGGVIYLVPEIALTAHLLSRVQNRFPGQEIAVIHSGIALGTRYDQWRRIHSGAIPLVVGARSALFAPVRNLRLIVVDEEHDPSYKQDERLRYNARDLALVLGKAAGALVILGSATPGIQTYFRAKGGAYRHLSLPSRIDDRPLPVVEVVDMKTERDLQGRMPLLSKPLLTALAETLDQKRQTLLFLNRRGFHTFLFCPDCGHVFACPSCDLSLTHHAALGVLKCHHCDFTTSPPALCPTCRGSHIRSQGAGTERIEEEVRQFFPQARLARMDSDTTTRKGDTERILRGLDRREIDILVGTQMITKGHDFPGITLVGVLAADGSMNIPDFRAAERTFQLLTQVSGRGGRGDRPGRVVIQTFNPNHYAIRRAQQHDYAGFYQDELPLRGELGYPPFSRLIGLHFSSLRKEEGKKAVDEIGKRARKMVETMTGGKADVIGPAESPLARLRGRHRWQMLLRGKESHLLHLLAERLMEGAKQSGLEIRVDVDPVHFM